MGAVDGILVEASGTAAAYQVMYTLETPRNVKSAGVLEL